MLTCIYYEHSSGTKLAENKVSFKCLHVPVEQLLRLGMDGEFLSCCMDDLPAVCDASDAVSEASAVEGELCFGEDCEP